MGFSNENLTTEAGICNVRQNYIQGIDFTQNNTSPLNFTGGDGASIVPNNYLPTGVVTSSVQHPTRRYQINFALGLFTQDKLVIILLTIDSN